MKKLRNGNKIAIFLDHRKLINDLYQRDGNKLSYKLREELFYFRERADEEIVNQTKKNRKRKAATELKVIGEESKNLQALVADFLKQMNTDGDFPQQISSADMPRYWEQTTSDNFPQFKGANSTDEFQSFDFNNQKYIIPPDCRFFNYDIAKLPKLVPQFSAKLFDLIVIDPPWRNKYIRRLKRARMELAYQMLDHQQLQQMPIAQMVHSHTLVAVWCTNSQQHQRTLINEFLPAWNLRLLHSLRWFKVNTAGNLIGSLNDAGPGHNKQPFEMLYIACHQNSSPELAVQIRETEMLLSVPSIVHSHKPPLLPWLSEFLAENPKCLEIFARYLQPHFTTVGLEVLKLMDNRLYECRGNKR